MSDNSITLPRRPANAPPSSAVTGVQGVRRNFSWMLVGNSFYALSQWGVLATLTKMTSSQTVGAFALALAVCAPVITFSNLNLRGAQATDVNRSYSFAEYWAARMLTVLIALVVIGVIALQVAPDRESLLAMLLVGISRAIESLSDVIYGLLQQQEQMQLVGQSLLLRSLGQAVLFPVALLIQPSLEFGLLMLIAVNLAVLVLHDCARAGSLGGGSMLIQPDRDLLRRLRALLLLTLPLGVVTLLDSLTSTVPRYFIAGSSGNAALGHYSALAYLIVAGHTFVGALADACRSRLAKLYISDLGGFITLLRRVVGAAALLGGAGIAASAAFGAPVLRLLYSDEYARQSVVLVWLAVAGTLWYVNGFLYTGLTAMRAFSVQVPILIVTTVAVACASYVLVPRFGIVGASWALALAMAVRLAGHCWAIAFYIAKRKRGAV